MTGLLWWASRRTWTTKWNYVSKQLCFSICCPLFVPPVNMLSMCCDSVDLNLHDHSSHLFSFHTSVHPSRHTPCPAESLLGGHSHDVSRHLRLCPAVDKQSGEETFAGPLFVVWLLSCFIGRWCSLWGKTEKKQTKNLNLLHRVFQDWTLCIHLWPINALSVWRRPLFTTTTTRGHSSYRGESTTGRKHLTNTSL